eukprot:1393592-Pyramimonas_sp.AAC.1
MGLGDACGRWRWGLRWSGGELDSLGVGEWIDAGVGELVGAGVGEQVDAGAVRLDDVWASDLQEPATSAAGNSAI